MKKLLSLVLTFGLFLAMGSTAFATTGVSDVNPTGLIYQKSYTKLWNGTNPGETISFTITPVSVTERPNETPPPFLGNPYSLTVVEGTTPTNSASIAFPTFPNVGTYYYTITETVGSTAGVTYDLAARSLKIIVVRNAAGNFVPYMYSIWLGEDKVPGVDNDFEASSLIVTKAVTGNLGDKSKVFNVVVTFTKPAGKTIGSTITYSGGSILPINWTGNTATVTIQVQDGSEVTFTNIPKGVTWKVDENAYPDYITTYTPAAATNEDFVTGTIDTAAADTVLITNDRTATPETGISLDSIPYLMILGLAVLGIGGLFVRRRQNSNL